MFVFYENCRKFVAAIFLFFLPALAIAAEAHIPQTPPSPLSGALQMLLGLGVVLLLIAGFAWLMKRFSYTQFGISSGLKVVSAVPVGQRERVVLVDVGDTRLVLGVAPGQVNKLMEMPRPTVEDNMARANEVPFMIKLKEILIARGEKN